MIRSLFRIGISPDNPRTPHAGAATMNAPSAGGSANAGSGQTPQAPVMLRPFTIGAREHIEGPFDDFSVALSAANTTTRGPIDVPAYGYLRNVWLYAQATGGTSSVNLVSQGDGPFIVYSEIVLMDVNGAPIVGPFNGFDLAMVNKYGGYVWQSDPAVMPTFSAISVAGNFQFALRIPVEITARDALGSLPNQNAAATYKVRYVINTTGNLYSAGTITLAATLRTRLQLEAWSQPTDVDALGQPQATMPPALGTTQFWSKFVKSVSTGQQTVQFPRVGNLIRQVIIEQYDAAGPPAVRQTANFPDPVQLLWDGRIIQNIIRDEFRQQITERWGYPGATGVYAQTELDNGIFIFDFSHDLDGHPGNELRDLYLPTTQASRLELFGTFVAGSSVILTNDVAPTGPIQTM